MANRLYIGGLSLETTEDELKTFFEQAGAVQSATVVIDKVSGQSRGFGFVEMSSDAEAKQAVSELNGKTLKEQTLRVEEARSSNGGRGRPGAPAGSSASSGRW